MKKRTIHFYIKEDLLSPSINKENGYYDFHEEDIQQLILISKFRNAGFPISMIRSIIKEPATASYYLSNYLSTLRKQKEYLEKTFNVEITEEKVRHAVHVSNQGRIALKKFYEVMKNDPAPMNGSQLFGVLYGSQFKFDKEKMPAEIDALREKLMKEYEEKEKPERKKRILLTGCPSSGAPMKVVKAIEEHGGNVVVYENCGGAKSVDRLIDEDAEDIYKAIAERYLAIGCSVMTPDNNRIELMGRLLEEYNIEGVVEMTLQACHTYNIEAKSIEKFVKSKGLPYIHVETDYSQADIGQLDTRIAAFLEMI